ADARRVSTPARNFPKRPTRSTTSSSLSASLPLCSSLFSSFTRSRSLAATTSKKSPVSHHETAPFKSKKPCADADRSVGGYSHAVCSGGNNSTSICCCQASHGSHLSEQHP